jgi:dirigent-like protein
MRRRTLLLASLVAISAVTVATITLSSAASSQGRGEWARIKRSGAAPSKMPRDHHGGKTIVLIARSVEEADIDADGQGFPAPGDYFVFRDDVFDEHGEDLVGRLNAQCFFHFPFNEQEQTLYCEGSLTLFDKGQLTFQGGDVFTEETSGFTVAITGGTGKFVKARGEVHVQFISEEEERLVIHLFT